MAKDNIISNVSMIQLNFDGINPEVYLYDNTNFNGKTINEIRAFVAPAGETLYSPFDGRTLLDGTLLSNLYIDLVRNDKSVIIQGLNLLNLDVMANTRNPIDEVLNFNMSKVTYIDNSTLSQTAGKCILLYVYYDCEQREESNDSINSVSLAISNSNDVVCLKDYITDYIGQQGCRIVGIETETRVGAFYLSLRDKSNRTFEYFTNLRTEQNESGVVLKRYVKLNDYDIDFRNSYIYNATTGVYQTILTLYYR